MGLPRGDVLGEATSCACRVSCVSVGVVSCVVSVVSAPRQRARATYVGIGEEIAGQAVEGGDDVGNVANVDRLQAGLALCGAHRSKRTEAKG